MDSHCLLWRGCCQPRQKPGHKHRSAQYHCPLVWSLVTRPRRGLPLGISLHSKVHSCHPPEHLFSLLYSTFLANEFSGILCTGIQLSQRIFQNGFGCFVCLFFKVSVFKQILAHTMPNHRIYSLPESEKLPIPGWMSSLVFLGVKRENRYRTEFSHSHADWVLSIMAVFFAHPLTTNAFSS